MITTHHLARGATLFLWVASTALATGCLSQSTNSSSALTDDGGSGSGSGSGGSGSGTGSGSSGTPTANGWGLQTSFDPPNSRINGYAYNPSTPTTSYTVEFWLDAPAPSGVSLGSMMANQFRFLFPNGNFGFAFIVPMAYQDGNIRRVWAYAMDGGTRRELGNSPMAFWAGEKPAGRAYFNANAGPSINSRCTSCHAMGDYNALKQMLATPSKFSGGTRDNNELILKSRGADHGGGNICGAGGAPCPQLQAWWDAEFQ